MDPSAWGTQVGEKTYQVTVVTFGTSLTPSFWQSYHSENAHKPQTNNLTNTDDPEIDRLIDEFEAATTLEDRVRLSHQIQELVTEVGAFIPSYKIPFLREAYWRWLQLPETRATRTAGEIFDPFVSGLLWIDEAIKEDTLAARRDGRRFQTSDVVDTTWRVE
jgi:microcin C transport system substrate-binding protein